MHLGGVVRILGEPGKCGLQVLGGGEQVVADRRTPFLLLRIPQLAQFENLAVERLLCGVGGEVVLADPILADDNGIEGGHDYWSFPVV